MIILTKNDLYVNCDCGMKFVATNGDFKLNQFNKQLFVECPTCGECSYVISTEFDTVKPEIKGEKIEDETNES